MPGLNQHPNQLRWMQHTKIGASLERITKTDPIVISAIQSGRWTYCHTVCSFKGSFGRQRGFIIFLASWEWYFSIHHFTGFRGSVNGPTLVGFLLLEIIFYLFGSLITAELNFQGVNYLVNLYIVMLCIVSFIPEHSSQ